MTKVVGIYKQAASEQAHRTVLYLMFETNLEAKKNDWYYVARCAIGTTQYLLPVFSRSDIQGLDLTQIVRQLRLQLYS